MGLEFAELTLAIEERYANEDNFKAVETFGDLCDMVKREIDKIPDRDEAEASYDIILANLLAELRTVLPSKIETDEHTKLTALKHYEKRERLWFVMQGRFPELVDKPFHYKMYKYDGLLSFCVGVSWFVSLILWKGGFTDDVYGLNAFRFSISLAVIWLFCRIILRKARTIGDIAEEIVKKRHCRFMAQKLTAEELESELREIICEQFDVREPEKITRATGLVKDLRLG